MTNPYDVTYTHHGDNHPRTVCLRCGSKAVVWIQRPRCWQLCDLFDRAAHAERCGRTGK